MALKDLRTIEDSEVSDKRIHQLRVRPNERSSYGAPGLTGKELQAKYDEYAELLRQRFNDLVEAFKASLDNSDENGSQIAEEIMVIVSEPDSFPIYTDNLKNAIQEMIGNIKTASYTANRAKSNADAARLTADEARNIADAAELTANRAEITANEAENIANEAKGIADKLGADGAVTTEKIADGAVTEAKLGDDVKDSIAAKYVAKPTDGKSWGVYVHKETSTGEGVDELMLYSATNIWPLTLVQRDDNGSIHARNPWLPTHVVNKEYVDKLRDAVAEKCLFKSTDTTFSKSVYVHRYENDTHSEINVELTAGGDTTGVPACEAWTIPLRYADGGLIVPKNPYCDYSATSKSYVDTKFATLEARITELEARIAELEAN